MVVLGSMWVPAACKSTSQLIQVSELEVSDIFVLGAIWSILIFFVSQKDVAHRGVYTLVYTPVLVSTMIVFQAFCLQGAANQKRGRMELK